MAQEKKLSSPPSEMRGTDGRKLRANEPPRAERTDRVPMGRTRYSRSQTTPHNNQDQLHELTRRLTESSRVYARDNSVNDTTEPIRQGSSILKTAKRRRKSHPSRGRRNLRSFYL